MKNTALYHAHKLCCGRRTLRRKENHQSGDTKKGSGSVDEWMGRYRYKIRQRYIHDTAKRPPILHQDRSLELNIPSFANYHKRSTSGIPGTDSLGKYDICDNADSNFLFLHILSLQKATGGFLIDENFAQILNTTLEELKSIASKIHVDSSIDKFKLLSTALVLRYLEREHGSKRHIWEEVVRKSRKWIIKVITEHQPLYEKQAIIDFADDYVKMALFDS